MNEVHFSSLIPHPDSVNPIADIPVSHCSFRKVSINDNIALRIKSVLSGISDISIKERQASALLVKCSKKLNHDDVETAFWVEFGLSDHDKDLNKHQCLSLVNAGSTWKVELWESDIIGKNISSDECSTVLRKIILKSLPPSDGPDNCLHVLMDSFAIASENDGIRYLITANIKNCYGIILWDVISKTGSMMHMVDDRVCNEVMRAMLGSLIEKGAYRHHLQAMVIGGWTPLLSRMSGYFKCIEPFLTQQGITIVQTVLGGTMNRKGWNVIFDVVTGALSEYEVCNNSTEYDLLSCHSKGNKESQPEGNEILAVNASFRRHQFWRACCSCVGNNRRGRANELRYEGLSEEKMVFTDLYGKKRVCTIDGFKKTNRALNIGIITENAFTPHENEPVNEREAPLQSDADNQYHGPVFQ